jgi:hypothetical protein
VTETTSGESDFEEVSIDPFVDFQKLTFVQILTGGPERLGIDG